MLVKVSATLQDHLHTDLSSTFVFQINPFKPRVLYTSSVRLHKMEVGYTQFQYVMYVLSVVSVTTAHAQYIKNKNGHFSADAELEDLGGTSQRVPKKKGSQVVKF